VHNQHDKPRRRLSRADDPDRLRWLFLDMNSFFASVEQQFRPECRGKPVGIIPVETRHTCCIALSYEAKRAGVKGVMRVGEARRQCPGLILVKARPDFYTQVHQRIKAAIERCAPIDTVHSIDEVAVRLGAGQREDEPARRLGRAMKRRIAQDVGPYLTCSIGVAPTRLLAKIACELDKPDGLTVLRPRDLPDRIAHLELDDLTGISVGMSARLHRAGVTDVDTLYHLPRTRLKQLWGGVVGEHYWFSLHGYDVPPPTTRRHSMGHAHVLPGELRTESGAYGIMTRLLHKAAYRARHHGYAARRLSVSVQFMRDGGWADDIRLPQTSDTGVVLEHFQRLWDQRPHPFPRPIKVGVTLGGMIPEQSATGCLFQQQRHRHGLGHVLDRINGRFGSHAIYYGGMHETRHPMDDKIAFGRVPEEGQRM